MSRIFAGKTNIPKAVYTSMANIYFKMYLSVRQSNVKQGAQREVGGEREKPAISWALSKWPLEPRLHQAEARNLELHPGLPNSGQGLRCLGHFLLLPQHIGLNGAGAGPEAKQTELDPPLRHGKLLSR